MTKRIAVAILGANRFFAQGIQQILLPHFGAKGIVLCFVGESEAAQADLVFLPAKENWPQLLCQCSSSGERARPAYITIQSTHWCKQRATNCLRVLGCIDPRSRPQALLDQVELSLRARERREGMPAEKCPQCATLALTGREEDVMRCMAWGMAQSYLPGHLHISNKTVSSHKRSAMRKLGFRRNAELYHWLRLGGLDQITRPQP